MFDIRNAQRSFNNSWLLRELADIPSGAVLDIAVTTPLHGIVYVAKMTEDSGYLSLSLKQGDVEIAYVRTSVIGDPVRMESTLPGVCAVVVLGFIPEGLSFTNPRNVEQPLCVISPELVTYFDYRYLTTGKITPTPDTPPGEPIPDGPGGAFEPTLDIVNNYVTTTYVLTGPVDIVLDPGLYEIPDPNNLVIDIDPITIGWTIIDNPGTTPLTTINGISYPAYLEHPVIDIVITPPAGGSIQVRPGEYTLTLESPELQVCTALDPIDNYIYPDDNECHVLDKCYVGGVRCTENVLESSNYGFNNALKVDEIDPHFD